MPQQQLFAPLYQWIQAIQQEVESHLPSYIYIHSRWSHKGNVIESQTLSRAHKTSKPDTGFNAAVLMGKVGDGIGSSTNDTIHSTRARTILVPL